MVDVGFIGLTIVNAVTTKHGIVISHSIKSKSFITTENVLKYKLVLIAVDLHSLLVYRTANTFVHYEHLAMKPVIYSTYDR